MTTYVPSFFGTTSLDSTAMRFGLSDEILARRKRQRREALLGQFASYIATGIILALYALLNHVTPMLLLAWIVIAFAVNGSVYVLSETQCLDRLKDHYATVWQVIITAAIQFGFIIAAPQISLVFLCNIVVAFSFAAFRLTLRQVVMAWSAAALCFAVLLFTTDLGISVPTQTNTERAIGLLIFMSLGAQCGFISHYGSSLTSKLYQRKLALEAANARIEELAEIDELTGAFNRRSIMRKLNDEIARSTRLEHPCSIALIDLDFFKRINDTFGHPAGDEVLRTFAIAAFANVREIDAFGRYGGEEFMLVMPETSQADAVRLLDRIRIIFADIDWSGLSPGLSISISAGIATIEPGDTMDPLLSRADMALYTAKRNGRNRVVGAA